MWLTSLGSGSSGNAFVIETENTALLLDCGVAARTLQRAIREMDLTDRIQGIVISHEHTDHIRSLDSLQRVAPCPIFATEGTFDAIGRVPGAQAVHLGSRIVIDDVDITTISVSHDAAEPCGFYVESGSIRAAVFTDLGIASASVADAIGDADMVVLEANYDPAMLRRSSYPANLKRRIRSPAGHLSNDDCASLLAESLSDRTGSLALAHLSKTNNHPDVAVSLVEEALGSRVNSTRVRALPRFGREEIRISDRPAARQAWLL